jgi:hypothetical protein
MENKALSTRIQPLLFIYDIQTKLFPNGLVDITEEHAHNRLNTKANHTAWLAGSLVNQRFGMANLFGSELKDSANELFKDYKGIQDNITYPPLKSYLDDWEKISPVLRDLLVNAADEMLDSIFDMGDMKATHFEMTGWFIHREAYVIGQIGLWRRLLGYDAMKYPM